MIPAWLGTDAALADDLVGKYGYVLKEMVMEWPFFQTQLDMLEMVLAKADADISARYDAVLVSPELKLMGDRFREQLAKTISAVCKIKGQTELLEKSPEIKQSLDLRHPYTDPLHFLQIELISRHRQGDDVQNDDIKKALLVTIAGIAAGMRNTG
jgi:phosphoenolpyruvate carboxylase